MRWSWRRAVGAWAAVVVFFAITTGALTGRWVDAFRLAEHGVATAGTVTDLDPQNHASCSYSYVVADHAYGGTEESCGDYHDVGDPIIVYYLGDHPGVATTLQPGLGSLAGPIGFALLGPALIGAVAGMGGGPRRRLQA